MFFAGQRVAEDRPSFIRNLATINECRAAQNLDVEAPSGQSIGLIVSVIGDTAFTELRENGDLQHSQLTHE